MKVVCISNIEGGSPNENLTVGKVYEAQTYTDRILLVTDNRGIGSLQGCYYFKNMFKTMQEVREDKLEELGI